MRRTLPALEEKEEDVEVGAGCKAEKGAAQSAGPAKQSIARDVLVLLRAAQEFNGQQHERAGRQGISNVDLQET